MMVLQELEDFLIVLRDDYDFLIPVDRLKLCLSCAKDITDVEEVLFRLQSLVCRSELQIETFRSLFAQRFLGIRPKTSLGGKKARNMLGSDDPLSEESKERLFRRADQLSNLVKEDSDKKQELLEEIKTLSEQQGKLREESEKAESEIERMTAQKSEMIHAAQSQPKNPKVQKEIENIKQLLTAGGLPVHVVNEVRTAVSAASSKKDLDSLIQKLLQHASAARSAKDSALFAKYLSLVSALKKFQSTVEKFLFSSQEKQGIKNLEKEIAARKKMLKETEEKQDKLNTTSYWKNQEYNIVSKRIPRLDAEREEIERRLKAEREREAQMVLKASARTHREIFTDGVNAVQTTAEQAKLMNTSLTSMSADDRNLILSFIRSNAKVFRQTLRRKSSTPRRHQVDIRSTARAAAKTNGEPIDIRYKKPKKSHAKVVILTDISGSCRQASTLALYFMGLMDNAFPGGCRKYVFVNHLISVDPYFRDKSAGEGVESVLENVPSHGIYSNYGATIQQLRTDIGGTIHKDTTVIILGDARNNRNQSAANDLKYIAGRCHKVFWLNTDDKSKWNTGDSVIGQYQAAGAEVYGIKTAGDLIGFLGNLSVGSR